MADYTPITPPDPSNGLRMLSGILGLQQQQQALQNAKLSQQQGEQALQTGAYAQQSAQAKAVQDQQGAVEMQNGARLFADPVKAGILNEDGSPTPHAQQVVLAAMPTTGTAKFGDLMDAAQKNQGYKSAYANLQSGLQNDVSAKLAAVSADPKLSYNDYLGTLQNIRDNVKGTPNETLINQLVNTSAAQTAKTYNDPAHAQDRDQAWRRVVAAQSRGGIGNAGITGPGGVATPQTVSVDTGSGIAFGAQAPALNGGAVTTASGVNKGLAPQIVTTPAGTRAVVGGAYGAGVFGGDGGNGGAVTPAAAPGVANTPTRTGAVRPMGAPVTDAPISGRSNLPSIPVPGLNARESEQAPYNEQIGFLNKAKTEAQMAANDPVNGTAAVRQRNSMALDLLEKNGVNTGPGTQLINKFKANLPGETGLPDSADNYAKLNHYITQNTLAAQSRMGVHTDAGAEKVSTAGGSVDNPTGALKEVVKVNNAMNTAFERYAEGLKHVTAGQVPAYQEAFRQNFNLNNFRLDDAGQRGDVAEQHRILANMKPQDVDKARKQRLTLKALTETGSLPGAQ